MSRLLRSGAEQHSANTQRAANIGSRLGSIGACELSLDTYTLPHGKQAIIILGGYCKASL